MNYNKIIFMLNVLSVLWHCIIAMPLTSGIFKGIFTNASNDGAELVEMASNELPEIQDLSIIDLSIYGRSLYGQPDFNKTGNLVAQFETNNTATNPEELGSYLEGDILMPQNSLVLKSGLNSKAYRWPDGVVPFEIAGDFTKNDLDVIAFVIDEYHAKTCVRFKPRTTETDYISIVGGNSGCWSSIGRMGGKQVVNFQTPGCLTKPGTAMHEFMHVLGFLHEQNRKERDSFVDIQVQNVQKDAITNFRRAPNTVAFGVKYDYGSVMHYSAKAFSVNGQPTIVPKKPINREIMGQRDGFSPRDIEKINRMYKCKGNWKPREPPIKISAGAPSRSPFAQGFVGINRLGTLISNIFSGLNRLG